MVVMAQAMTSSSASAKTGRSASVARRVVVEATARAVMPPASPDPRPGTLAGQRPARALQLLRGARQRRVAPRLPLAGDKTLAQSAAAPQPAHPPPQLETHGPSRRPMATPATHPAPLTDAPLRRQNPREEPSALDAHAEICAGAASNGGPYRDPETKCGASAVLDTGPAFTILGCRKPAWRRSGRAVSGQRGAWISSSPDSPDASGDASFVARRQRLSGQRLEVVLRDDAKSDGTFEMGADRVCGAAKVSASIHYQHWR